MIVSQFHIFDADFVSVTLTSLCAHLPFLPLIVWPYLLRLPRLTFQGYACRSLIDILDDIPYYYHSTRLSNRPTFT